MLCKFLSLVILLVSTSCIVKTDGPISRDSETGGIVAKTRLKMILPGQSASSFSAQTDKLFELEKEADIVVNYNFTHKLDIGVGESKGGVHYPQEHSLEELQGFFDEQRHKDLLVVILCKHAWTDEKLQRIVLELKEYFVARGYKWISIQQAYGSGRGLHLNHVETRR